MNHENGENEENEENVVSVVNAVSVVNVVNVESVRNVVIVEIVGIVIVYSVVIASLMIDFDFDFFVIFLLFWVIQHVLILMIYACYFWTIEGNKDSGPQQM